MVPFLFHTETLQLLPCGALWWPSEKALLVADLHFGKAAWFAAAGQFLPPYDSMETAMQLADRVKRTGAQHIFCLGDSFHDAEGASTLEGGASGLLAALAATVHWVWITGNHDNGSVFPFGRAVDEVRLRGIALRHEADPGSDEPEISGHFHPKIRLHHRGRGVSRRCFLATNSKIIMPAFGALTGGLDARHPAIHSAMRAPVTALVPSRGRLLRFPVEPRQEAIA